MYSLQNQYKLVHNVCFFHCHKVYWEVRYILSVSWKRILPFSLHIDIFSFPDFPFTKYTIEYLPLKIIFVLYVTVISLNLVICTWVSAASSPSPGMSGSSAARWRGRPGGCLCSPWGWGWTSGPSVLAPRTLQPAGRSTGYTRSS